MRLLARKSSNKYLTMPVMAFVHLKKGKKKPEVEVLSLKKGKLVLERNGRRTKYIKHLRKAVEKQKILVRD